MSKPTGVLRHAKTQKGKRVLKNREPKQVGFGPSGLYAKLCPRQQHRNRPLCAGRDHKKYSCAPRKQDQPSSQGLLCC